MVIYDLNTDMKLIGLFERIDVEKTVANYGRKLALRWHQENGNSIDATDPTTARGLDTTGREMITDIAFEVDPSPNQRFTLWIIQRYIKGGIYRWEDMFRVKHALYAFMTKQRGLPIKDIGQIKSLPDLEALVDGHDEKKSGKQLKKELSARMREETDIVYDGPDGMILQPHTPEASCFWGQGTRWCTAATSSDNMFHHYDDGNLYIVIRDDRRFQVHPPTQQYMDERDTTIHGKDLIHTSWFFEKLAETPDYWERFQRMIDKSRSKRDVTLSITEHMQNDVPDRIQEILIHYNWSLIKTFRNPSEHTMNIAAETHPNVLKIIFERGMIPSDSLVKTALLSHGISIRYLYEYNEDREDDEKFPITDDYKKMAIRADVRSLAMIPYNDRDDDLMMYAADIDPAWVYSAFEKTMSSEVRNYIESKGIDAYMSWDDID